MKSTPRADATSVARTGRRGWATAGFIPILAILWLAPVLSIARNRTADQIRADRQRAADSMERVVYKQIADIELKLHILRPLTSAGGSPRPAIVFFHGGGFRTGNPDQFFIQANDFAKRGVVAISAEYRLKDDVDVTIAGQIEDAKSAIRWVRSRATELGVDPRRIIAAGGSAGGYLALATALFGTDGGRDDPVHCAPDALVLYNPAIDFELYAEQQGIETIERALGGPIRSFSGTPNVRPGLPPTILFQGTNDEKTPHATAVRFADLMRKCGNICKLVTFDGMEHGFHNRDPFIGQCLETACDFLGSRGFDIE